MVDIYKNAAPPELEYITHDLFYKNDAPPELEYKTQNCVIGFELRSNILVALC